MGSLNRVSFYPLFLESLVPKQLYFDSIIKNETVGCQQYQISLNELKICKKAKLDSINPKFVIRVNHLNAAKL